MIKSEDEVFVQMRRGMNVLFLGQGYLAIETGTDPFLSQITQKYGAGPHPDYDAVFAGTAGQNVEQSLAWMDERCRRIPLPHWLNVVADFPWNAVFTSAIDSVWPQAFVNDWRSPQPIFLLLGHKILTAMKIVLKGLFCESRWPLSGRRSRL